MMKKYGIGVFIMILCLIWAGNRSAVPVSAYIGDEANAVSITHHLCGQASQWTAEGEALERLRAWAAGLTYRRLKYEEGHSPGDVNGGEAYDFVVPEGDCPGFVYVINGADDCYLLIEGCWYVVDNPSAPPIRAPW